jgi:beta-glucosidase
VTINEPWVSAFLGYHRGIHAPGLRDLGLAVRASHHMLLAHARAVEAFRSTGLSAPIGITLDSLPSSPASDREVDRHAARLSDGATNRWFLDPLFRGAYPTDAETLFETYGAPVSAVVQEGDLAAISTPIDFLGVNYYFRRLVRASAEGLGWTEATGTWDPASADNEMHWGADATGLTEQLERIRADYQPIPIYVTENGIALRDEPGPDGSVADRRRITFLRDHLRAAERALAAGVDLRGYFVWSLLDDFEWSSGYRPRFGLVHVDFPTQRRTPKSSARWYADVIRANAIAAESG